MSHHLISLYTKDGDLHGVLLSAELWLRCRERLEPFLSTIVEQMQPLEKSEPLHEWEELKQYWDFKYPYNAHVECGNCGIKTEDWEHDASKRFTLKGANIGGLAVFRCESCGAVVRKKHFKDHICFEFSTEGCGCK